MPIAGIWKKAKVNTIEVLLKSMQAERSMI